MGLLSTVTSSLVNTIERTATLTDKLFDSADKLADATVNTAEIVKQTSEIALAANIAWSHDTVKEYDVDTQHLLRTQMPELKFLPAAKPKARTSKKQTK